MSASDIYERLYATISFLVAAAASVVFVRSVARPVLLSLVLEQL